MPILCRVAPDTELTGYSAAGYPANLFCRISGIRPDIRLNSLRVSQKNLTVDIFLNNFYCFQYFTVIFNRALGFEVRIPHVKFRNDISMYQRGILI